MSTCAWVRSTCAGPMLERIQFFPRLVERFGRLIMTEMLNRSLALDILCQAIKLCLVTSPGTFFADPTQPADQIISNFYFNKSRLLPNCVSHSQTLFFFLSFRAALCQANKSLYVFRVEITYIARAHAQANGLPWIEC